MTLLSDPVVVDVAGHRALITHGDAVGAGATPSRIERRFARTRPFVAMLRLLHPDWVARIQPYTTTTRRQVRLHGEGKGGGPKHRAPEIEAWAREVLLEDKSLDFVVAAHAHLPALVEVEPGRFYPNSGDWITHSSYLVVQKDAFPRIRRWPPSEEADLG